MKRLALALVLASTVAFAQQYELKFLPDEPPSRKMTESELMATPEYKTALIRGRLLFHTTGLIGFSEGPAFFDAYNSGKWNETVNNYSQQNWPGYCNKTGGLFRNGKPVWRCYVLNPEGRLENTDHNASGEFDNGEYNRAERGIVRVVNGKIVDTLNY